jgi:integrase
MLQSNQRTPTLLELPVPLKLPPHVKRVRNRSGRSFLYLMKHRGTDRAEKAVRLPDDPRSPEFWAEYARLMQLQVARPRANRVAALAEAWQASPEWQAMSPRTQGEWGRLIGRIVTAWGEYEVRGIEPKHVLALRDQFAATPATANNMLRCLSSMLAWSVPRDWRSDNPCREIKLLKSGDGYAPWPWDIIEIARAELRPDLWWAVALALYTGQRLSDVLAMKWSAINSGGLLAVQQSKTGKTLLIPLHRDLRSVLDGIPRRAVTILTSSEGAPWRSGFQTAWQKHKPFAVSERGLVFHGLRKSAVVTLLEAGCTDAEVSAITGQSRTMVEHYARQVNQQKLAAAAILKWETSR